MRQAWPVLFIAAVAGLATTAPRAFLTREQGQNAHLRQLLEARGVMTTELPCIAFEKTGGFDDLCTALSGDTIHPWVVITSPAAADVFAQACAASLLPSSRKMRLASVGVGSAKVLESAGLQVDFLPSRAVT